MTTRSCAMQSIEIPSTSTHACWTLFPSPTALHFAHSGAVVEHLKPLDLVTGRSCYTAFADDT
jgi:hypothetical protein